VCAVGIGQAKIVDMKASDRICLIRATSEVPTRSQRFGQPLGSDTGLAGDVYELSPEDAQAVSDQIRFQMWLTDPYDDNTKPFVTIPISWKLRDEFISQRPKMM